MQGTCNFILPLIFKHCIVFLDKRKFGVYSCHILVNFVMGEFSFGACVHFSSTFFLVYTLQMALCIYDNQKTFCGHSLHWNLRLNFILPLIFERCLDFFVLSRQRKVCLFLWHLQSYEKCSFGAFPFFGLFLCG